MIEDLKRTLIPRKYKDLLIKSRMNCFKFSLKIFLMFSVILILLNVPNVINMSYEIENFITAFETLGFEGSHYVLDVPLNSSLNSEIQQLKNSRGITVFEKGNVSFSHEKSSTLRENRAELSIELHSEIKTNNTLNAMMFCLAILLRVKNNLEL